MWMALEFYFKQKHGCHIFWREIHYTEEMSAPSAQVVPTACNTHCIIVFWRGVARSTVVSPHMGAYKVSVRSNELLCLKQLRACGMCVPWATLYLEHVCTQAILYLEHLCIWEIYVLRSVCCVFFVCSVHACTYRASTLHGART